MKKSAKKFAYRIACHYYTIIFLNCPILNRVEPPHRGKADLMIFLYQEYT
jgi:hypothetical protein